MRNIEYFPYKNILSSPFILALPIAILIIIILPDAFNKYEIITLKEENEYKKNSTEKYQDLNGDGISERIVAYDNRRGFPAIQVLKDDNVLVDQWNLNGTYPERSNIFYCADLDHNGLYEIYIFTMQGDSLLLNIVEPFPDAEVSLKDAFICKIWRHEDGFDFDVVALFDHDLDNDGTNELIFKVKAGFSKQPRGLFAYNRVSNKFSRTPVMGANINRVIIEDLDSNSFPEIYCSCSTRGNIHDSLDIPFNDYSSWLMGFDHNLNFLFDPVEFPFYPSSVHIGVYQNTEHKLYLAAFFNDRSKKDRMTLTLFNHNGEVADKTIVPGPDSEGITNCAALRNISLMGEEKLMAHSPCEYFLINSALAVEGHIEFDENYGFHSYIDVENDGAKEFILCSNSGVIIARNDFSYPVKIANKIDPHRTQPIIISKVEKGNKHPELFIKIAGNVYYYIYKQNPLFYFKYIIWLAIYAAIVLLVYFFGRIQTWQLRKKLETMNTINRLRIKTIQNQISPHFTFNAIHSISGLAVTGDMDRLNYYTKRYASLMRRLLENADKISVSLQEEVDFTIDYLETQSIRYEGEFEYNFHIHDEVNMNTKVPRSMIHTFAENAVKYGLRGMKRKGVLDITIENNKNVLSVHLQDNGEGKSKSLEKDSTGKGYEIIEKIFELYTKIEGRQIEWTLENAENTPGMKGTRIMVNLKIK
jgi:hypothetical protein